MPSDRLPEHKSAHRLAFDHYLRTGERLTSSQWLTRHERKFNPYHDERGRFTSPPGVTVSWGKYGRPGSRPATGHRRAHASTDTLSTGSGRTNSSSTDRSANGFRSDLVRSAVSSTTNNADTYFELNKRQAALDRLRAKAGPNPPSDVKADLQDFQRRLDANRALLDERSRVADKNLTKILRAGLAPVDVGVGAMNIATGQGDLGDYLAVGSAIPIGGAIGKIGETAARGAEATAGEVVQLGGSYRAVRKLRGYHAHHMPADSISPLSRSEGPAIAMLPEDHMLTESYGSGARAAAYREKQAQLISQGHFGAAVQMDIDDIVGKLGEKYSGAIKQVLKYSRAKGI